MRNINLAKSFVLFVSVLLLSASFTFAQDAVTKKACKTSKEECKTSKKECSSTSGAKAIKHKCTDACHTIGCDAVKAAEAKLSGKHVCTDACKTVGCDAVKAAEAKLSSSKKCGPECKDGCTDACKLSKAKMNMKEHIQKQKILY